MKKLIYVISLIIPLQVAAEEATQLEGILSWNDNGFAEITDCKTGIKYTFGVMASAPYFNLYKKSEELQKKGTILVTVKGNIENKEEITSPNVLRIINGGC